MHPVYPVYVPSKGRWATPLTTRHLSQIGVPHRVVVQPQQADQYAAVVEPPGELLLLPPGLDGLVPTRNWIWDHARDAGADRFWTFDDNIQAIYRLHRNAKIMVADGTPLRAIEAFVDRFENVPIAGMQYEHFALRRAKYPPFSVNCRVYSNMLIETRAAVPGGAPYRNRGVYNDDTDLCLQVLRDGFCTILFNVFLVNKLATMRIDGGNTPIYQGDGRLEMAKELQGRWPNVVTIKRRWNRWQHVVDYSPFKHNRLRLRPGAETFDGSAFEMRLVAEDPRKNEKLAVARRKREDRT